MTPTALTTSEKAEALERIKSDPAVTIKDVSLALGIHVSTVQRSITRGDFPYPICRIGQRYVVPTPPIRKALCLTEANT
ncbi:helix-turn-helix domain-containing protein [Mycobacterium sp. M1]|uniref:Helix-turn-helix domain-containing protein n=1 Tax=Mycolicibacter acidiphilus TaxID=2835306 RepID=A0ABS5RL87_9MYCO|nr:helix-turn-helix domain-containing protein [Mycolicibacter acidiphilus]MBS9535066.1 helix-turn-helix domain-containing protein [Mycolicibacter acidiphilus]